MAEAERCSLSASAIIANAECSEAFIFEHVAAQSPMYHSDATMRRHPIGIILFTILIDTLGIGILGPILPQLLGNPNSPHYLLGKEAAVGSGYIMTIRYRRVRVAALTVTNA